MPKIACNFSESWVQEELKKEGAGSRLFKDTHKKANGLMLRVSPKGKGAYFIEGRIKGSNGSVLRPSVGDPSKMHLYEARNIASEFHNIMELGKDPRVAYYSQNLSASLESVHNDYISQRDLKDSSLKSVNGFLKAMSPKFKTRNILSIRQDDIIKEHESIKVRHTGKVADKVMRHVDALYRMAAAVYLDEDEMPIVQRNPVDVLRTQKKWFFNNGYTGRKAETIDTVHLPSILSAIAQMKAYRGINKFVHKENQSMFVAACFFELLLFTGWRPSDAVSIEWHQVSDDCKEVSWSDEEAAEKLKNAEGMYKAPLNRQAQNVLLELKARKFDCKYVFPNASLSNHLKANPTDYNNKLTELADTGQRYTAGIFRKAYQTFAEYVGVNSVTIKRLVFHTQKHYTVQGGYIFPERENLRKKSQRVADFILLHGERTNELMTREVQIDSKLFLYAQEELSKNDSQFDTAEDILEHWCKQGRVFEEMKNR